MALSTPIFKNLNILKFEKLVVQRIILMMFKFNIGKVPKAISDIFTVNWFFHKQNTRSVGYLHTPFGKSEDSYSTFSYIGTHIWNHMSQNVSIDVLYLKIIFLIKFYILNNEIPTIRLNI